MVTGEKTKATKATSKTDSLRTTIPKGIVRQFGIEQGDSLDWKIEARNGDLIIVINPNKKSKR